MLWIKIKKSDLTFTEGSWTLSNAHLKAVGSFREESKSIIDRVYVTQEGEESKCHLFIKGNKTESYDDFFVCSDNSIDAESQMCDSEEYREGDGFSIG